MAGLLDSITPFLSGLRGGVLGSIGSGLQNTQNSNTVQQALGPEAQPGMGPLITSNPQAAQMAISQRLLREQLGALQQNPQLQNNPGLMYSILQDPAVRQQFYETGQVGSVELPGGTKVPVIRNQGQLSLGIPGGKSLGDLATMGNDMVRQNEAAKALGTAQGTAQGGLPNTQALIDKGLEDIDALIKDPQLKNAVGLKGAILTQIPGTAAQGPAARLAQLHGESSLVGLQYLQKIGRLNINEFNAGANAISRLQAHQSYGDVIEALGDLKKVFQTARSRSGETAGIGPTPAPQAQSQPSQQPAGGNAPTAINRATGQRVILQNGQWVPIK